MIILENLNSFVLYWAIQLNLVVLAATVIAEEAIPNEIWSQEYNFCNPQRFINNFVKPTESSFEEAKIKCFSKHCSMKCPAGKAFLFNDGSTSNKMGVYRCEARQNDEGNTKYLYGFTMGDDPEPPIKCVDDPCPDVGTITDITNKKQIAFKTPKHAGKDNGKLTGYWNLAKAVLAKTNGERLEREGWTMVINLKEPLSGVNVMSSDFGLVSAEEGSKYISVTSAFNGYNKVLKRKTNQRINMVFLNRDKNRSVKVPEVEKLSLHYGIIGGGINCLNETNNKLSSNAGFLKLNNKFEFDQTEADKKVSKMCGSYCEASVTTQLQHCAFIDYCATNPCKNNATCLNGQNSAICRCKSRFEGDLCEVAVASTDYCAINPCQNKATCLNGQESAICQCSSGFEGKFCEVKVTPKPDIDYCSENLCQHNSTCISGQDSYTCTCQPGYKGKLCESEVNECDQNPCKNGGTCIDQINSYSCSCPIGWEGPICNKLTSHCSLNLCKNDAECIQGTNETSITCSCLPGWSGVFCEININDCEMNPCKNNGICIDKVAGFSCQCLLGWRGNLCDVQSTICDSNPCQNNGICTDVENDFDCNCQSPWLGIFCTFKGLTLDDSTKDEDKGIATPQIGPHGPSQLIKGPCQDPNKAQLNGICRDIPSSGLTKCGVLSAKKNDLGLLKSNSNQTEEDLTRIYGGIVAKTNQWPWQISVRILSDDQMTKKHHCGGSVINSNYVISAAHCFKNQLDENPNFSVDILTNADQWDYANEFYEIYTGPEVLQYYEEREFLYYIFQSQRIVVHPRYHGPPDYSYDVSVIQLQHHIPFNHPAFYEKVMPICLETEETMPDNPNSYNLNNQTYQDTDFWVTGWGSTSQGIRQSPELMAVNLPFFDFEQCQKRYQDIHKNYVVNHREV